jgi:hypothetical protein
MADCARSLRRFARPVIISVISDKLERVVGDIAKQADRFSAMAKERRLSLFPVPQSSAEGVADE